MLRTALFDERDFETLEKNYQNTLIAPLYLIYVGRYNEALAYMENAEDIKKENESLHSFWYAEALFYSNDPIRALEVYKNDYALFRDNYDWLRESTKYLYLFR